MPFDPSGNFSRVHSWQQDRDNGIRILADRHDEEDDNFGNAFNLTFLRTGTVPMTGNLVMGGNGIKLVDAGTEAAPGLSFELSNQTGIWQPNPTTLAFSSNGVKKFEVNGTGIGIFGTTAFGGDVGVTGNISTSGSLTVAGNIDCVGSALLGPSVALRDDAANNGDVYLNWNNHENTVNYANIGVNPAGALLLQCRVDAIHSVNAFYADTTFRATGLASFYGGIISPDLIRSGDTVGSLVLSGGTAVADGGTIALRGSTSSFNAFGMDFIAGGSARWFMEANGNFVGQGNCEIIAPGGVTAPSHYLSGIPNAYWAASGSNPVLGFNANEYLMYDRAGKALALIIGGTNYWNVSTTQFNVYSGVTCNFGNVNTAHVNVSAGLSISNSNLDITSNASPTIALNATGVSIASLANQNDGNFVLYRNTGGGPVAIFAINNNAGPFVFNVPVRVTSSITISGDNISKVDDTKSLNLSGGPDLNSGAIILRGANQAGFGATISFMTSGAERGKIDASGAWIINGNTNISGTLSLAGYIYSGKVHAITAGDGNVLDCKDQPGNPHSMNIRFLSNDAGTQYGSFGYPSLNELRITANDGNIGMHSPAGSIYSHSSHFHQADCFYPNIPASGGAANCFLSPGNQNQMLRSSSSLRYKTNVQDIPDMSGFIDKLRPVSYNSLGEYDDPDRTFYGMIAEELDELDKNFVEYDAEGRPDGLGYTMFIPLLVKEVQALRGRVAYLEGYGARSK